jgi:Zn-finger nucleic acid-binding protein
MVILELNDVEIDYCLLCNGIWLDNGELELIAEDKNNSIVNLFEKMDNSLEKSKKCPVCRKKMKKIKIKTQKENIIIDKCENHGIWFDKGELYQILKQVSANSKALDFLKDMFLFNKKTGEN